MKTTTGIIYCLVLTSLCTAPGTPLGNGDAQYTPIQTGNLCVVYGYSLYNSCAVIYKHMCKMTEKFKEIKYCCVRTCLAVFFGTGDTSRISMIYKWHFCRSHIFPLLCVRYCKTNSLNRNSGIPLCTYHKKRHKSISSLFTHHNFTES